MTYDYECPKCGQFEVEKPMSDCECEEECPKCMRIAKRLYTVGGIHGVDGSWRVSNGKQTDRRKA